MNWVNRIVIKKVGNFREFKFYIFRYIVLGEVRKSCCNNFNYFFFIIWLDNKFCVEYFYKI